MEMVVTAVLIAVICVAVVVIDRHKPIFVRK